MAAPPRRRYAVSPRPPPPPPEPPTITGNMSPVGGPHSGGTTSMLPGTGFTGATGVVYGAQGPAVAWQVVSDNQLWAESPPGPGSGTVLVHITVQHPLGNATRMNAFAYTGT